MRQSRGSRVKCGRLDYTCNKSLTLLGATHCILLKCGPSFHSCSTFGPACSPLLDARTRRTSNMTWRSRHNHRRIRHHHLQHRHRHHRHHHRKSHCRCRWDSCGQCGRAFHTCSIRFHQTINPLKRIQSFHLRRSDSSQGTRLARTHQ